MYERSSSSSSSSTPANGGGMGSFLEELQARGLGVEGLHTEDVESKVISALANASSKDIARIISEIGNIPLGQLLQTIEKLVRFGLIERRGAENDQEFAISEAGKRAAQMMGLLDGSAK